MLKALKVMSTQKGQRQQEAKHL